MTHLFLSAVVRENDIDVVREKQNRNIIALVHDRIVQSCGLHIAPDGVMFTPSRRRVANSRDSVKWRGARRSESRALTASTAANIGSSNKMSDHTAFPTGVHF